MKGLPFVLLFTAMTFVSWGAYGPVLHHGAIASQHDSLRAFVGVGLAYFLIAVIIPALLLRKGGEKGKWTLTGTLYSLVAGAVGAIGALGIILALGYGGQTVYVMPLVFGFAPVVNTLVSALLSRTFNQISPIFIGGIIAAALGAGGVLFFKPTPPAKPAINQPVESKNSAESETTTTGGDGQRESAAAAAGDAPADEPSGESDVPTAGDAPPAPAATPDADQDASEPAATDSSANQTDAAAGGTPHQVSKPIVEEAEETQASEAASATGRRPLNIPGVVAAIVIAALCWGSYGPMLHIGQAKMHGSRMRPFTCVGMAYFIIAVAVPLVMIYGRTEDSGAWTTAGMSWSFLAGVAGAIGALGVILAFNAGGKPYYVMPLIFGFAPVINTFISLSEAGTWSLVTPMFWISLAVVIAGAVTVLTNAPKPQPQGASPKAA